MTNGFNLPFMAGGKDIDMSLLLIQPRSEVIIHEGNKPRIPLASDGKLSITVQAYNQKNMALPSLAIKFTFALQDAEGDVPQQEDAVELLTNTNGYVCFEKTLDPGDKNLYKRYLVIECGIDGKNERIILFFAMLAREARTSMPVAAAGNDSAIPHYIPRHNDATDGPELPAPCGARRSSPRPSQPSVGPVLKLVKKPAVIVPEDTRDHVQPHASVIKPREMLIALLREAGFDPEKAERSFKDLDAKLQQAAMLHFMTERDKNQREISVLLAETHAEIRRMVKNAKRDIANYRKRLKGEGDWSIGSTKTVAAAMIAFVLFAASAAILLLI
jgi:hypothetical protein